MYLRATLNIFPYFDRSGQRISLIYLDRSSMGKRGFQFLYPFDFSLFPKTAALDFARKFIILAACFFVKKVYYSNSKN